MIELPRDIGFQDVSCYRSEDDLATFYYIPGAPTAQKAPDGSPTLNLWLSGTGGILQLGMQWEVDSDLLERLRSYLAGQYPDLKLELIRLSLAPVSVEEVTLDLGDGTGSDGSYTTLASTTSANYPPFNAIFNLQLTDEQKTPVVAALNGRANFFNVAYHLSLASPSWVTAKVILEGDVKADLVTPGRHPSLADCRAGVASSLAAGRLTLHHVEASGVPNDLWQELEEQAKEKAAIALLQMADAPQSSLFQSHLHVSAAQTISVPQALIRSTDVSTWFQNGTGPNYIHTF
jgi:hypothetical protein